MTKKTTITKKFIVHQKESCGFADNRVYAISPNQRATVIFSFQDVEAYNEINKGDTLEIKITK